MPPLPGSASRLAGHFERYRTLAAKHWPSGGGPPRDPITYLPIGGGAGMVVADRSWRLSAWATRPPRCACETPAPPWSAAPGADAAAEIADLYAGTGIAELYAGAEEAAKLVARSLPFVERGGCAEWGAMEWSLARTFRSGACAAHEVTVCTPREDGGEDAVKWRLGEYISELDALAAAAGGHGAPYLRAWDFERSAEVGRELRAAYDPPAWAPCYFDRLPDLLQPRFRWLFIGPAGCETLAHVDPLLTHAWLAQVEGSKRVRLVPPWLVSGEMLGADAGAARQFRDPSLAGAASAEVELGPGDVLFVPQGWAHYAVSLSHSVTLTHNFLPAENWPLLVFAAKSATSTTPPAAPPKAGE